MIKEKQKMPFKLFGEVMLNQEEAMSWLGVNRMTLYNYRKQGMPCLVMLGKVLYPVRSMRLWIINKRGSDKDPGDPMFGIEM